MPVDNSIKKVLVIGSGPIIIGQAAEFDYAGTQACKSIREAGIEVVLVNSNPATIMTDDTIADAVYIQPLNVEALEYIIERERPDGLLGTLGGQTGLNLTVELNEAGILEKYNVRVLGTPLEAIKQAEDRALFRQLMIDLEEPIPGSKIITTISEGIEFAEEIGYPIIVRPAYTLGGTGGGIANNKEELASFLEKGLKYSRINQVLLEQSVAGWKEIEYEVMRDSNDTCIIICNMENIDPVGVHTGDSMVVAPSQTLTDNEYHMLRESSIKIVRALKIEGGCNVQLALNPVSREYIIIEVNPRVSRSSALASKAAGYPIAKVAAKIAIGLHLHEIPNAVTKKTMASFEPTLDYVVVKIPKWPFDKFAYANRDLGTQMKATGEVMAIDRKFESALLKAVISLEGSETGLYLKPLRKLSDEELINRLYTFRDDTLFVVAEALRRNNSVELINDITKIDKWFLYKIRNIINIEKRLENEELNAELLKEAESMGFTDFEIERLTKKDMRVLDAIRRAHNLYPVYKMVDTCAAEFEAQTPYYYSTYEKEDENIISKREKIIVIGSGPIRIGQGIEFDYCSVHAVEAIKKLGYESIIINNNPETVSTDFDTSDKLYFEPLFIEDVHNVIRKEMPKGVIVQFGGQTAINLAPKLVKRGVQILGTSVDSIDAAEDRKRFERLLTELNIPQPVGFAVFSKEEAIQKAAEIGYPVLVRPSYVIGGRAMQVVHSDAELISYVEEAVLIDKDQPILIDGYIEGTEVEVDAIVDRNNILIPGIMEHIERTGVHSGDSACIYPPQNLSQNVIDKIVGYTEKLAKALQVLGLMNIQYVVKGEDVYVIEVNPRASRTVPILSKVTQVPMVELAMRVILGESLVDLPYGIGLYKTTNLIAVKMPVFSNLKLKNVDVALMPEMKSTGEVLGVDDDYSKALLKSFLGAGYTFRNDGKVLLSMADRNKEEALPIIQGLSKYDFELLATEGTHKWLEENGVESSLVKKDEIEGIEKILRTEDMAFVVNLPTLGKDTTRKGFQIRDIATQYNISTFTCLDTLKAYIEALDTYNKHDVLTYKQIKEYK
ncbi:carbamoyl-phosphate synthase large subunit [Natranaerovirga pectinivora]|uniref:Carbamoyl phosphate synthase large chain n=1 Tax=Natranaerovirga pectinivora TaxID=682400 RepID=A0A4R3MP94_9FIRM|nr:carbamoyl-phosphate synthase (glutamine-hydrolyzing) large subunit [Natranaerovirga pectinivora]TCT16352.1 carbamoyl-phosphate synthase large subunit [Natranaerovirga pectinivora]